MKRRTCPYCNYRYTIRDYTGKLLFKFLWSEWNCRKCNNLITFDARRRIYISLSFGLWIIILLTVKEALFMTGLWWILFAVLLSTGGLFIYLFDSFVEVRNK